jgi:Protein of unknown function (DUF2442)
MSEIPRIVSAEPVIHGVLKIEWNDGYAGIVDLRPVIDRGGVLAHLQDPDRFRDVRVGEYGHSVFWRDNRGEEIDFGTDSLRRRAVTQEELHQRAG